METIERNDRRIAYEKTVVAIKTKRETKKKWRQRKWVIFFWSIGLLAGIITSHYVKLEFNVPIALTIYSLIVFILFLTLPWGEIPEMSQKDIEFAIVHEIAIRNIEENKIKSELKVHEKAADLQNENWSEDLQDRRNYYEVVKTDADELISCLNKERISLQKALDWSASLPK